MCARTRAWRHLDEQVARGGLLRAQDVEGPHEQRRIDKLGGDLLDSLGETVERLRREPPGAHGLEFLKPDEQRAAVDGEAREVASKFLALAGGRATSRFASK